MTTATEKNLNEINDEELFLQLCEQEYDTRVQKDDPEQRHEVVPMDEWLTPYYIGGAAPVLYDFWRYELIKLVEGGYSEWIIDGSLGSGKTFSACLATMRKIYELSCYEYPQRLFGFNDEASLFFGYLSVIQDTAYETGFKDLTRMLDDSRYFNKEFPRDEETSRILKFPKNFRIIHGADQTAAIGSNLFGCILDEVNFWKKGSGDPGDMKKIRSTYRDVRGRRKMRFEEEGMDPGLTILVSSTSHDSSFTEEAKEKADDNTLITTARSYQVKPWRHCGKKQEECPTYDYVPDDQKFIVFCGSTRRDPQIVDDPEFMKQIVQELDEEIEVDTSKSAVQIYKDLPERLQEEFVMPPEDLRQDFKTDTVSALQDMAGEPVGTQGRLFSNIRVWKNCLDEQRPHPFDIEEPTISTDSERTIDDFFTPEAVCTKETDDEGNVIRWRPKQNPEKPRFLHIDLSTTDHCTGICMGHISDFRGDEDGQPEPIVTIDLMLRVKPPNEPAQLDHEKIREFVAKLKKKYNFPIVRVGMDQYSAPSNLQLFNKNLMTAEDEEAVRNGMRGDRRHLNTVQMLHNERIRLYPYSPLRTEFFSLLHNREDNEVVAPKQNREGERGYDDLTDAFVSMVALAVDNAEQVEPRWFDNEEPGAEQTREEAIEDVKDEFGAPNPEKDRQKSMDDTIYEARYGG